MSARRAARRGGTKSTVSVDVQKVARIMLRQEERAKAIAAFEWQRPAYYDAVFARRMRELSQASNRQGIATTARSVLQQAAIRALPTEWLRQDALAPRGRGKPADYIRAPNRLAPEFAPLLPNESGALPAPSAAPKVQPKDVTFSGAAAVAASTQAKAKP